MNRPIIRLLTAGFCAAALAGCGDDGGQLTGASEGNTEGSSETNTPSGPGQTSESDSAAGTTVDNPTTGMGMSDTQATTEGPATTDAGTTTSEDTQGVTEGAPECGNGVQEA